MSNIFKGCSADFNFQSCVIGIAINEHGEFLIDGNAAFQIEEFELFVERSRRLIKFANSEIASTGDNDE